MSDMPSAACACLHVEYTPNTWPDGSKSDNWTCKDCGSQFMRHAGLKARDLSPMAKDIAAALNRYSAENGSDTPDFVLAEFLVGCLGAFDKGVNERECWYGHKPSGGTGTAPVAPGRDDVAVFDRLVQLGAFAGPPELVASERAKLAAAALMEPAGTPANARTNMGRYPLPGRGPLDPENIPIDPTSLPREGHLVEDSQSPYCSGCGTPFFPGAFRKALGECWTWTLTPAGRTWTHRCQELRKTQADKDTPKPQTPGPLTETLGGTGHLVYRDALPSHCSTCKAPWKRPSAEWFLDGGDTPMPRAWRHLCSPGSLYAVEKEQAAPPTDGRVPLDTSLPREGVLDIQRQCCTSCGTKLAGMGGWSLRPDRVEEHSTWTHTCPASAFSPAHEGAQAALPAQDLHPKPPAPRIGMVYKLTDGSLRMVTKLEEPPVEEGADPWLQAVERSTNLVVVWDSVAEYCARRDLWNSL